MRLHKMSPSLVALLLVAVACAKAPTIEPPSTQMAPVAASVDQVWESAIEVFAERTYLIANLEKVSGLIVSDYMTVSRGDGQEWADCGKDIQGWPAGAQGGRFNFRVDEDEGVTRIKVTARWTSAKAKYGCVSTGIFEDALEASVRIRAEREAQATEG